MPGNDQLYQNVKYIADVSDLKRKLNDIIKKFSNINVNINATQKDFVSNISQGLRKGLENNINYNSDSIRKMFENMKNINSESVKKALASIENLDDKKLSRMTINKIIPNRTSLEKMDKVDQTRLELMREKLAFQQQNLEALSQEKIQLEEIRQKYNALKKSIVDSTKLAINQQNLDFKLPREIEATKGQVLKNQLLQERINAQIEKNTSQRLRNRLLRNKVNNSFFNYDNSLRNFAVMSASAYGSILTVKTLFEPAFRWERSQTTLQNILPLYGMHNINQNREFAKREMREQFDYSKKLGINPFSTLSSYSAFMASRLQGVDYNGQKEIARNLMKYFAIMNLDKETTTGAFLAFSQMASKGIVSMEEARRQLSNHIPGSWNLMADAMGMTPSELEDAIRSGTLQASELMINLSKLIEKRFGNVEIEPSLFRMAGQMGANIFDILSTIAMNDSILKFFNLLNKSLEGITIVIKALAPAISKLLVVFGSLFLLSKSLSILVAIPSFIGGHIFGLLGNLKTSFMTMGAYFKNQESIKYMNMLNSGLITPDMMPRRFMKGKLGKTLMYTGIGGIALMGVGSFLSSKSKEGTLLNSTGNIMSGIGEIANLTILGSSIGSMIAPGIGSAIGAGLGAIVGIGTKIYEKISNIDDNTEEIKNIQEEEKNNNKNYYYTKVDVKSLPNSNYNILAYTGGRE